MLLYRDVPKETIKNLKVGDYFVDSEIVIIQKKGNLISIVTKAGSVFKAHQKTSAFNVFKKAAKDAK
jgi:hypothetical protein